MVDRPGKNRRNICLFICADTTTLRLFDVEIPEKCVVSSLSFYGWLFIVPAASPLGTEVFQDAFCIDFVGLLTFVGVLWRLVLQFSGTSFPRLRLLPHPEVRKRP